jgi:DNA-binding XRE family transcriptional regulator
MIKPKAPVGGGWLNEADGPKKWVLEWASVVHEQRLSQSLTLDDVAQMSGVTRDQVSRYESGKRVPRLDRAMAISDALGIGIEW